MTKWPKEGIKLKVSVKKREKREAKREKRERSDSHVLKRKGNDTVVKSIKQARENY